MECLNLDLFTNPFQVALADGGKACQCLLAGNDASASRATTQQVSKMDIDHLPTPAGLLRKGGENRPKNPEHLGTHQPFFGPLHDSPAFHVVQHTCP